MNKIVSRYQSLSVPARLATGLIAAPVGLTLALTTSLVPLALIAAVTESPTTTATNDSITKPTDEPVITAQPDSKAASEPENTENKESTEISKVEPQQIAEAEAAKKAAAALEAAKVEGLELQAQAAATFNAGDPYGARTLYEQSLETFQVEGLDAEADVIQAELDRVVAEITRLETPAPAPAPAPVVTDSNSGYVAGSCKALKAQGLGPFYRGDPNYTARRDRDNDGIACE